MVMISSTNAVQVWQSAHVLSAPTSVRGIPVASVAKLAGACVEFTNKKAFVPIHADQDKMGDAPASLLRSAGQEGCILSVVYSFTTVEGLKPASTERYKSRKASLAVPMKKRKSCMFLELLLRRCVSMII